MAVAAQTSPERQLERAEREGWRYDGSMATEGEVLHLLTALVLVTKPDVCVETGTFSGAGTKAIAMALGANERGHLWTVENDLKLVAEYAEMELDRVSFVAANSLEWSATDAPAGINFALVDCCEEPGGRVEVFKNLLPRMTPGGLICAHDTRFYRPEDYLDSLCDAIGRPPNIEFPALNGIGIWVCE